MAKAATPRTSPSTPRPDVAAVSNTFAALDDTPVRPQTTIVDAIRWRSSTTQGSRRDFLRQQKSAISEANQAGRSVSSTIVKPDMSEAMRIRTSRHMLL